MFERILLVYSEKITEKHLKIVGDIKEIIEGEFHRNCTMVKATDLQENLFKNLDLVVSAGGDGAFIRASHYLRDTPILGINSEPEFSEGALTTLKDIELDKFREILKGDYKIMQRQRAVVKRNNVTLDELALNEVYVGAEAQFHTSKYVVKFDGKEEEQRSSGVLVATGAGSGGWYKSSGGEAFNDERELRFLVREPFQGKLYKVTMEKGIISEKDKIEFIGKRHDGGIIAIDSNKTYDFNTGDVVEISLSDKPLKVIVK